jgi:hypothetical protein
MLVRRLGRLWSGPGVGSVPWILGRDQRETGAETGSRDPGVGEEMYGLHALFRVIGLPVLVLAITAMAVPAATAQDRPTGVAQVKVQKRVLLNDDGTLTVVSRLRCDPGWVPSDLTVSVAQGPTTGTEGLIEPSIPCDGHWHRVQFDLPAPAVGTFQPGKATFSAQFLVFNVESGDPSAGHERTTVLLHRV